MDVLKSYLALACVAFLVGFGGYWMLSRTLVAAPAHAEPAYQAPTALALPADNFDRGKRI